MENLPVPSINTRRVEYTPLEERFLREMIADPSDATAAAIRAGYAPLCASQMAATLLRKPHIYEEINKGRSQVRAIIAERTGIELAEVVELLARLVRFDPAGFYDDNGNVLPVHEMPLDARLALEGLDSEEVFEGRGRDREHVADIRKLRWIKRGPYVEMLMKHLGGFELDNRQKTDPVTELLREINGRRNSLPIAED